ncbi:RT0821/Lpp0805 family surface protein [Variovorax sp. J22R133]|uniref:RT0821/Lpp0805 family surface protein n=1 Tax=Variovorax brevis TaxID=3053503 RepID=UPI002575F961|nr:RT0821/Lpp0805 family surface protein [Variovorax sp. J22R133]MDM0113327.1 RT0821/Lpp0805 family surface protein [Variovorax sp. J22R133]
MRRIAATMLALAATVAGPAAHAASDLLFLKNSPASKFSAADFKMLRGAIDKSLAGAPEGEATEWKNDKTGAAGTVTPAGVDSASPKCRKLRIANSYKLMKDEGVYTFCQGNTGQWKLR